VALLDITVLGHPILRRETTPVAQMTPELRRLVDDMFETMYAARGIGLAAPQVNRGERIAVVDVQKNPIALINPRIVAKGGTRRADEGCLSIPDVYAEVTRANTVRVEALDVDLNPITVDGSELFAACLQHEIDHLHGRLFLDHLSILKRRAAMRDWEEERGKYPDLLRRLTPEVLAELQAEDEEGDEGPEVAVPHHAPSPRD
jgi:peptide deformylase